MSKKVKQGCSVCGQDHSDQRAEYPVGATLVVVGEFSGIKLGTLGKVVDHCEDGRAFTRFEGHDGSHTFHYPAGYIAHGKR